MRFCSEWVLKYLRSPRDNLVATMRTWCYRVNQNVVLRDCNGRVIGYGIIAEAFPVTKETLEKWLPYSGFNTVEEWIEEAKRLHHGKLPNTLYLVYIMMFKRR